MRVYVWSDAFQTEDGWTPVVYESAVHYTPRCSEGSDAFRRTPEDIFDGGDRFRKVEPPTILAQGAACKSRAEALSVARSMLRKVAW